MALSLASVIVAVKNGERYLAAALRSIAKQRYRPIEIIVVDGRSFDGTVAVAQSFAHTRIIQQPGEGIADAYNAGIEAAQGEFTAFLSSDDIWAEDKLKVQIDYMRAHPHIQYTVGKARFLLEPGVHPPPGFRLELLQGAHTALIMETLVARRSVWQAVGCFDTGLRLAEDVDWFSRARHLGIPMAALPHMLLYKRVHDANASLDIETNNHALLRAVKGSIQRQKGSPNGAGRQRLVGGEPAHVGLGTQES